MRCIHAFEKFKTRERTDPAFAESVAQMLQETRRNTSWEFDLIRGGGEE